MRGSEEGRWKSTYPGNSLAAYPTARPVLRGGKDRDVIPLPDEYSIDEVFADLTGLRRPLRMSYEQMAAKIKHELDTELGFTFSVGLAPNKVLAKIGSKWKKPSDLLPIEWVKIDGEGEESGSE
jgi:nucleotidyltransferase/DNA polymerase involved in DNA repair